MPRVGELILLAAPSCCGKTYFLKQMLNGRTADLTTFLGISPDTSYLSVVPTELAAYRGSSVPRMILQFTIPIIPLTEGRLRAIADDPRIAFVRSCERVTAITMLASGSVLNSRLRIRNRSSRKLIFKSLSKYLSVRRKNVKLQRIYSQPESVLAAYDAWFLYLESLPNVHNAWLVMAEDNYEVFEPTEWQRIRESYFPGSQSISGAGSQSSG